MATATATKTGARRRIAGVLERGQWKTVVGMSAVILGLHLTGFYLLFEVVVPHSYSLGASGAFTAGVGITAYTLGMRHAFDADHISAIDNTTRKLMSDGKRPLSVGFYFSLGHSTVVFVLAFMFAVGIKALSGQVEEGGSALQGAAGWIGPVVSSVFLYMIAALNLLLLIGILRVLGEMRRGNYDDAELNRQLDNRGLMNRFFRRFTRLIGKPRHMYPIGILFGLGFDTATEVSLLFLAAGAAGADLPFLAILCLPVLFAAGMCLLDTLEGSFMNFAYDWALSRPVRKIYYNITITALSIMVALMIGSIGFVDLLTDKVGLTGGGWETISGLDLNYVGYGIVGLFALTWVVALIVWRFGHIEQRWSDKLKPSESP